MRRSLIAAMVLFMASLPANAETIEIAGPSGPLAAEMIAIAGAANAVVIVPGSGPTDRDGNSPNSGLRSDSYKLLAEALADAGIASLRIDKRGLFGSAAAIENPNDVTIAAYADDLSRWVARAGELAPCVWIAGHSEGGLVGLVAATGGTPKPCGLILLATPGRSVGDLLLEQLRAQPGNASLLPEIQRTIASLKSGNQVDPEQLSPLLRPLFGVGLQRYMIDLFSYDPAVVAKNWSGPILIVQGTADLQVKPLDASLLATALPAAERLDLEGATHLLKRDVPGEPFATYGDPELPLHPDLVPGVVDFIARHRAR